LVEPDPPPTGADLRGIGRAGLLACPCPHRGHPGPAPPMHPPADPSRQASERLVQPFAARFICGLALFASVYALATGRSALRSAGCSSRICLAHSRVKSATTSPMSLAVIWTMHSLSLPLPSPTATLMVPAY